jgi:RND family efflux transporter MFP subunit
VSLPRLYFVAKCFFVALSLGSVCCNARQQSRTGEKAAKQIAAVRGATIHITPTTWPKLVRVQGSLVADETAAIGAQVAGRIVQVHADLGDRVEIHSPLASIDDSLYKLLVSQADAQLQQARSAVGLREGDPLERLNPDNAAPVREAQAVWEESLQAVERVRKLAIDNAISKTDVEVAESAERVASARLTSAQNGVREKLALIASQASQLNMARQDLDDTVIRAPFSGLIQSRTAAVGAYVQPGLSLFSLVRLNPIRFRSAVPERYAHLLKLGQEVVVRLELSSKEYRVKITRISPALDPLNRSLTFEALIDNADGSLQSGLFADAEIVIDNQAKAIVVPNEALVRFAGVDKVWRVEDDSVKEVVVLLGRREKDRCEIQGGLKEGDEILLNGEQGKTGKFERRIDDKTSQSIEKAEHVLAG